MKIPLASHSETYSQLIRRSLRLYKHVFFRVFIYSLLLAIIAFIPQLSTFISDRPIQIDLTRFDPRNLWLLLINICALVFFAAQLWRVRCVVRDEHESVGDDIKVALKHIPAIFAAVFLQVLLIITINFVIGTLVYFIIHDSQGVIVIDTARSILAAILLSIQTVAVFYALFAFYFYLPIILVENKGILESLRKSASLVWRHWWQTVSVQLTPWLCFLLTLIILQMLTPLSIRLYFYPSLSAPDLLSTCVTLLIFALYIPWVACLLLLQLHNLELEKTEETSAIIPG